MPKARAGRRWTASACAWWQVVWKSAPARQWNDSDRFLVERLLHLVDTHARRELRVGELTNALAIERELGLSPRARTQLRWLIVDGGARQERPRSLDAAADVHRIRAVDPQLAKELAE